METRAQETGKSEFKLITTKEAANRLGVKDAYIKRMCREGKLKGFKVGKFWRVTDAAIADLIDNLQNGNGGNGGNGGFSQDAKDRIRFHANLRSQERAPESIDRLNQNIEELKAAMKTEDSLKRLALAAKLRELVLERETKRNRLDHMPEFLDELADSAYPGMKDLVDEDPDTLEAYFASEVQQKDQAEGKPDAMAAADEAA